MARQVLTISMPPKLVAWVRQRIADDDEFDSISDYIRELILNDRSRLAVKSVHGHNFDTLVLPGTTFMRRLK